MSKIKKATFKIFGFQYNKGQSLTGWLFMAPAVILGIVFVILPMVISLSYAFTDANLLKLNTVAWNGIENFKRAFQDKYLWNAFVNTLEFVVKVVPIQMAASVGLALILNSKIRFNTFFRWAFFTPVMLSLAVTSFLWMNLLNEQQGLINQIIGFFGISPQKFLSDPKQAMNIIVFISAWQGAGYQMLIFLSAFKNVPAEIYEAAKVDGASRKRIFFSITLPMIVPTFSFVLITMLIGAFRLITQPMVMTGGGPLDTTMTMSYYIYSTGLTDRDVGYSSAIALIYTVFMAAIALSLRRLFREERA